MPPSTSARPIAIAPHPSSTTQAAQPVKPPRTRVSIACRSCRTRRIRCLSAPEENGTTCAPCIASGSVCEWPEEVATGSKVPPEYIAALEERVAKLQEQLSAQQRVHRASDPRARPSGTVNRLMTQTEHYLGPSSGRDLARRLIATLATPPSLSQGSAAASPKHSIKSIQVPVLDHLPAPASLPAPDVAHLLIKACFGHIQLRHPFLHLPSFLVLYASVVTGTPTVSAAPFLAFAVCAVGARVLNYQKTPPEAFLSAALTHFEDALAGEESLESIQCLLLLAIYSLRSPRGPGVWQLVGLALSRAISTGLHREDSADWSLAGLLSSPNTASPLLIEMRRRVWWSLHSLDVATSVMLGRPPGVANVDVTTPLPSEVDGHEVDENLIRSIQNGLRPPDSITSLSAAIHSFRLRQIEAEILSTVFSRDVATPVSQEILHSILTKLTVWWTTTPRADPARPEVPNSLPSWYDMRFHQTILLAHSTSLAHAVPGDQVIETAAISAAAVCHLSEGSGGVCFPLTFPLLSLHSAFVAGVTLLLTVRIDPLRPSLDIPTITSALDACQATLDAFESRWPAAVLFSTIMRSLTATILPLVVPTPLPQHPPPATALGAGAVGAPRITPDDLLWQAFSGSQPIEQATSDLFQMAQNGALDVAAASFVEPVEDQLQPLVWDDASFGLFDMNDGGTGEPLSWNFLDAMVVEEDGQIGFLGS